MEQKVTPPWMIALITSLFLLILNLIGYVTNQLMNKSLGNIQFLIIFVVIIFGCIYYAKQMNGKVGYGNVFAHGFKITAGIAALLAIFSIISIKFIYPEIVDMSLEQARTGMEKAGKMTTDDIDSFVNFTRSNFLSFTIGLVTFFIALTGFIASLIGAGLAKKTPISPFENAS
jgi:hypothetical protein